MPLDPFQALGVGQNRHVPGQLQIEKRSFDSLRHHVVRRLDEHIARVGKGQHLAAAQSRRAIRRDVIVRTRNQPQRNAFPLEHRLQCAGCVANAIGRIVIEPRQDVRRASDDGNTVGNEGARHFKSDAEVGSTIVEAGQNVTMQIDHARFCWIVRRAIGVPDG